MPRARSVSTIWVCAESVPIRSQVHRIATHLFPSASAAASFPFVLFLFPLRPNIPSRPAAIPHELAGVDGRGKRRCVLARQTIYTATTSTSQRSSALAPLQPFDVPPGTCTHLGYAHPDLGALALRPESGGARWRSRSASGSMCAADDRHRCASYRSRQGEAEAPFRISFRRTRPQSEAMLVVVAHHDAPAYTQLHVDVQTYLGQLFALSSSRSQVLSRSFMLLRADWLSVCVGSCTCLCQAIYAIYPVIGVLTTLTLRFLLSCT